MTVRFGVFADLHSDFMHDAVERVEHFLRVCEREQVDFAVQLGDFCPPNGEQMIAKEKIINRIQDNAIPFYHALGNHDMDYNTKQEVLSFLGERERHFSFDCNGFHFVVLDANFYCQDEMYFPYERGNYRKVAKDAKLPILPPSELVWLKKDLAQSKYPSVIFTHQSLIESRAGIYNTKAFRKIAKEAPKGVRLAICGHEHVDRLEYKRGTYYYCMNSMSYYWSGSKYKHDTYDKEITAAYPKLESIFPYKDPLYAIFEMDDAKIRVRGVESEFVGATPKDLQFKKWGLKDEITPRITSREVKVK